MRRRFVLAAALEFFLIAVLVGMSAFSMHMAQQERVWREQGEVISSSAQVALDVSLWWFKYWWVVAPLLILGGLVFGAVIVFTGRPASAGRVQT